MAEPSRLMLLEQLHIVEPGTKVRFLGCVHTYNIEQAQLFLCNQYPATDADISMAIVNIENVLENASRDVLDTGSWVNVVGYVRRTTKTTPRELARSSSSAVPSASPISIEATMLWSAGAIKLDKFNGAVREYQRPLKNE